MKLAERIFRRKDFYVTSPYGQRNNVATPLGYVAGFHTGTDYGTRGEKWPQYALENGVVLAAGRARDGAIYAKIYYPRPNITVLHWHLDCVQVKKGDEVTDKTKIGLTGKTGRATGVHLHLGLKLGRDAGGWKNPDTYNYTPPEKENFRQTILRESGDKVVYKTKTPAKKYISSTSGKWETTANLYLREGAGTEFDVMTIMPQGSKVRSYGYLTENKKGERWFFVVYKRGRFEYEGFCSSKYLIRAR